MSDSGSFPARSKLHRERIYEEDLRFEVGLSFVSLDELRRAFAAMFDRAAGVVEGAGFALDDAVVVRLIRCRRHDGREWLAEAESLTDRGRLIRGLLTAVEGMAPLTDDEVDVVGLRIEATVERWES